MSGRPQKKPRGRPFGKNNQHSRKPKDVEPVNPIKETLNAANVAGARREKSPGASVGKREEQTASGESAADARQGVTPGASVGKLGDEKRTGVGGHPAALASARWDDEADARRGVLLGASVGKRTLVVRMKYYDRAWRIMILAETRAPPPHQRATDGVRRA